MAPQDADDVFTTPATSNKSRNPGLASPSPTPAHGRSHIGQLQGAMGEPSSLAQEALSILRKSPAALLPSVKEELLDLLNRHDLRTQGIAKGRELSRLAVTAREKRITELENRITGLENEKETQRQVISHLKQDMVASPTKPSYNKTPYRGRGRDGFNTSKRSEV
jgi:hypothetical protein